MRVLLALLLLVVGCAKSPRSSTRTGSRTLVTTKPEAAANPDGLGFYSVNAGVPAKVAAAADSTFLVMVLGEITPESTKEIDVSNGGAKAYKAEILASDADDMDKTVVIKQLENCEAYADIDEQKKCVVTLSSYNGTAFLAGDGKTLWTNAHLVEHSLKYIEGLRKTSVADQLKARGRVAMYVFSRDGKLLVNPNIDPVQIKIVPPLTPVAKAQNEFYGEDSDYMALTLTKSIGTPLKIAEQINAERLFILGYPTCTNCPAPTTSADDTLDYADRAPRPNSDGKGLKVTSGAPVDPAGLEEFFQMTSVSLQNWDLQHMLFTTADSQHGNSGGPVLNARGEVVAIHAGGKTRRIDGLLTRISRGVIPAEFAP